MDYCVQNTLGNRLIDNRELLNPENTWDGHMTVQSSAYRLT